MTTTERSPVDLDGYDLSPRVEVRTDYQMIPVEGFAELRRGAALVRVIAWSDGDRLTLRHTFRSEAEAWRMAVAVAARGDIDRSLWDLERDAGALRRSLETADDWSDA